MLSKVGLFTKGSPLGYVVLNQVNPTGKLGTIFSSKIQNTIKFQESELSRIPIKKAKVDYHVMLESLPSGKDIVHRGMSGHNEVISMAEDGKFGAGKYTKRKFNLDIASFIHRPESCMLLSTSPDPHTVKQYMIGFQLIRAIGAIASMGLPHVYIRPQTARHVDIEQFEYYQTQLEAESDKTEFRRVENIFDLAQGNNETTVILGAKKGDDWRPLFNSDLHSIVLAKAAGRILSGFTKAETVETVTIENPDFHKKVMSIEVFSTALAEGSYFHKYFERMNKRAQELGLIPGDRRILTLTDASTLMSSSKYMEITGKYKATGETMIMQGVPKTIPFGSEELVEYAVSIIEAHPQKELVTPTVTDSPHV